MCGRIPISLLLLLQYEVLLLAWPCDTYISLITVHLNRLHFGWSIFMGNQSINRNAGKWFRLRQETALFAVVTIHEHQLCRMNGCVYHHVTCSRGWHVQSFSQKNQLGQNLAVAAEVWNKLISGRVCTT